MVLELVVAPWVAAVRGLAVTVPMTVPMTATASIRVCCGLNCSPLQCPSHSYAEALTPPVTVFGDGAFRVVMKVTRGQKGGALNPSDQSPYRKRERDTRASALPACHGGKAMGSPVRRRLTCSRDDRLHREPKGPAASPWTPGLQTGRNPRLLFKPHVGCFVMAARAD